MIPASVSDAIQATADALYVPWLVILLFGSGLFLTLRFGVVQLRRFREALGTFVATPDASAGGALSPFQAFMTALAATIGTGNIAGVAAGIVSGGPGALFWIWCYGFVATAVKFSEAVLGVTFRDVSGGRTRTGPMYYLRDGLKSPVLAWVYALIAGVAALTTTPFTQTNSIALVWNTQFGVPTWASGVLIAVLTWLVIIGGIESIGKAAQRLTPLKVGLYLAGGLFVIVSFASRIPDVLALVFREAFSTRAAAGGAMGFLIAMRYGLARGMYANEAGYGTAAVAYGTARSRRPAAQGLNAVMEVFIVSFVTSTISAMVVLLGAWDAVQQSRDALAWPASRALPPWPIPSTRSCPRLAVGGGLLRVSLRLHDAHRLGLLRRAVSRVHLRPARGDAISLDLLRVDSAGGDLEGRPGVGLGRLDERPADLPEHRGRAGVEWVGRQDRARAIDRT